MPRGYQKSKSKKDRWYNDQKFEDTKGINRSRKSKVLSATNFVNQGPPKKYPLQNLYLFTDPKNLFNNHWQGALLVQQCFWCLIGRTIFVNQGPPLPERFTSKVTFIHHYWKLVLPYLMLVCDKLQNSLIII
jgi:hypothetical protein